MPFKIFIHGLESSNRGAKALFFKERYPDMVIPDFRGDLPDRMRALESILEGKSDIRLVGSSFGGLMATLFTFQNESKVDRLILLAPAIHMLEEGSHKQGHVFVPVTIYHGTRDEIIPLEGVEKAAKRLFLNLSFNSVEDDHYLHRTFKALDWDRLLLQ
ncbi:MAG: alpha/beta hydrolase [Deltaproteobacteria bacterium]|nr:alpha/beta hydrolase [Deltaproteobacteria bacterium]